MSLYWYKLKSLLVKKNSQVLNVESYSLSTSQLLQDERVLLKSDDKRANWCCIIIYSAMTINSSGRPTAFNNKRPLITSSRQKMARTKVDVVQRFGSGGIYWTQHAPNYNPINGTQPRRGAAAHRIGSVVAFTQNIKIQVYRYPCWLSKTCSL